MIKTGIPGQWELALSLEYKGEEIKDSQLARITPDRLKEFYIIEEIGNTLPYFNISFESSDKWRKYWNENSSLKISMSMGDNSTKIVDTKMAILKKDCKDIGNGFFLYSAEGLYVGDKSALVMCQTPFIRQVGPCIGTDCIEKCAEQFFKKVSNEASSTGRMPWFQTNETYKDFMDRVIKHSYIEDSFVTVGITMNGEYRIIDTVKKCQGQEQWTIGKKGAGSNNLPLIVFPVLKSNSGIQNALGGYGVEVPIISTEYGVRTNYHPKIELGLTNKDHPETPNIQRKTLAPVYYSGTNETEGFIKAPVNYEYGNSLLRMEQIDFVTLAFDSDIKVCDIVKVFDVTSEEGRIAQDTSGKYLVSKVIRGIANLLAQVRVIGTRDSGLQQ